MFARLEAAATRPPVCPFCRRVAAAWYSVPTCSRCRRELAQLGRHARALAYVIAARYPELAAAQVPAAAASNGVAGAEQLPLW